MTLIIVERVTPGLLGKLTRWMLEVQAGVFVGNLTARVREKLWLAVRGVKRAQGACVLVHSAPTEQGFSVESAGEPSRSIVDFDGLVPLRRKERA